MVINTLLVIMYLLLAANRDITGKQSVIELLQGKTALAFWIGVVTLGIVIPLGIAALSHSVAEHIPEMIMAGVVCEMIGGLSLRYYILKVGIYKSLFPTPYYLK